MTLQWTNRKKAFAPEFRNPGMVVAATLLLSLGFPSWCEAGRKALVIGVNDYQYSRKLENPVNDANAITARLELCGFTVTKLLNPTVEDFRRTLRTFGLSLTPADDAIFFFAGHGIQVRKVSYLIPVDAQLEDPDFVDQATISLDQVLRELDRDGEGARMKVVMLDCCRDDPFGRSWRGSRSAGDAGLAAPVLSADGTVLCFATDPGQVAADGMGQNSPYTTALLEHLFVPGREFQSALMDVGNEVKKLTGNNQRPWRNSNLNDPFYFIPGSGPERPVMGGDLDPEEAEVNQKLTDALRSETKSALPAALQHAAETLGGRSREDIPDEILARLELVCLRMALQGSWESEIDLNAVRRISEPPFDSSLAPLILANEQLEMADLLIAEEEIDRANERIVEGFKWLDLGITRRSSICQLKKGSLLTRHLHFKYGEIPGLKIPGDATEGLQLLEEAYSSFRSKHLGERYFGPGRVILPFNDELCEAQAALVIAQCWHHGIGTGTAHAFDPAHGFDGKQSGKKAIDYYEKVLELDPASGEARGGLLEMLMQKNEGYWTDEMVEIARRGVEYENHFCMYHYASYLWDYQKSESADEARSMMQRLAAPGGDMTTQAREWLAKHR